MNDRLVPTRLARASVVLLGIMGLTALWDCSPSADSGDKCKNGSAGPNTASEIKAGETYEIVVSSCNTCGHCKVTINWTKPPDPSNTGPVVISFLPKCQSGEKAGKYFPNPANRTASVHEGSATLDLGGRIYCGENADILWDGTIYNNSPHPMKAVSAAASGATMSAITLEIRPYTP